MMQVLRDGVNRSQGQQVHTTAAGVTDNIYEGLPVFEVQDSSGTIGNYQQVNADVAFTGTVLVAGLALEGNVKQVPAGNNPGAGYGGQSGDYTRYNRGGLVSYMGTGALLQLSDGGEISPAGGDGSDSASTNSVTLNSHPVNYSSGVSYILNQPLFVAANGKISNSTAAASTGIKVGVVKGVSGSGDAMVLQVETRY